MHSKETRQRVSEMKWVVGCAKGERVGGEGEAGEGGKQSLQTIIVKIVYKKWEDC
jgi:hypothetical protein